MIDFELDLEDEAVTATLAAALAKTLEPGEYLALAGDLGAGKTAFARGLVAALGADPRDVMSPTYAIVQRIDTPVMPVIHADLHRLADPAEVDDLDLGDWADDGVLVVEWPERAAGRLGEPDVVVELRTIGETKRLGRVRMRDEARARQVRDTFARSRPKS